MDTVKLEGDDGKTYELPTPVARQLIHVERLARQMIDILDHGKYPAQNTMNETVNVCEGTALYIAKKLRQKSGKFQMMREAVAEWIEEGKWKDA